MKFTSAFACVVVVVAFIALSAVSNVDAHDVPAASTCHNATGSCRKNHFVCANEEVVPHSKRCDGVEDCADGTDEFMCDQSPKPVRERSFAERSAIVEGGCIQCTCLKGSIIVAASGDASWWNIGLNAPRDSTMLTDAPSYGNKPCNPASVTSIKLNVYKKQSKGCRGWVCCLRQEQCVSCGSGGTSATHCYV